MRARYVIMDLVTSVCALLVFNIARFFLLFHRTAKTELIEYVSQPKMVAETIFLPLAILCVYWLSGYYNHPFGKSRLKEFATTLASAAVNTVWIWLALMINDILSSRQETYELLLILFGSLFLFSYSGRLLLTSISIRNLERKRWSFRTVIIGDSNDAIDTASRLNASRTRLGFNVIGHIHIKDEKPSEKGHRTLTESEFQRLRDLKEIDQLIIVPDENSSEKKILNILHQYFPTNIPIKIRPSALAFVTSQIRIGDIYGEPFIDIASPAMSDSQLNVKRVLDIILSVIAMILAAPIYLAVALAVKFSSKGPVLYRQERIGFRQKPFDILKFRTMYVDAEANGPMLSSADDSRITPVGKFLRKYRLDEIPQFWNVLKGEMSLVGPRPERAYYINQIVVYAPHYTLLHQVKPGITSWGMVKFGYAREVKEMIERSNFDLVYLSNMSVAVDFKILLHTIKTVFLGKGM